MTTATAAPAMPKAKSFPYNGRIAIKFGDFTGDIIGGPYRLAPLTDPGTIRVKLAKEINAAHDIKLDIVDFSTPPTPQTVLALTDCLRELSEGRTIYVGCMGGMGRTGLFLALLVKVARDYAIEKGDRLTAQQYASPVAFVRANYYSHAVETEDQSLFVQHFDTDPVLDVLDDLQPIVPVRTRIARVGLAALGLLRRIFGRPGASAS